ncbi:hypothetical protein DY000_02033451 [Brassica cretica]|uniref:Uncharacterized protein n=1 Tax=Brassica cretica TaxID=69181 RepID=A0ABQ7DHR1_BRACR|nr:hypothetical protein DY000_02033451 [Brassica cretica]
MTVKFLLTLSRVPETQVVSLASRKKNPKKMIITFLFSSMIASADTPVTGLGGTRHLIANSFMRSSTLSKTAWR